MRSLPGRLSVLLGVLLVCSCGQDHALSPTERGSDAHLTDQSVREAAQVARQNLSVVLTLRDGDLPVSRALVSVRPSTNGSGAAWIPGGVTDARGKIAVSIPSHRPSGYFHFKATSAESGDLLGQWSSVPVNHHQEVHVELDMRGLSSVYPIPKPDVRRFVLPGGSELEMVFVPGGHFMMGSPSGEPARREDEGPQTNVRLTEGFYVGRCEVTQRQWLDVMGTMPWQAFRTTAERLGMAGLTVARDADDHPAESVGWDGVQAFIEALNAHAGRAVYRLPTEAEWEYFARADSDAPWSFGGGEHAMSSYAWVKGSTIDRGKPYAHPVGTKRPNRWGLFDVYGNVAEWVQDWYRPYRGGQLTDPQGPLSGVHADRGYRSKKVVRGGSLVDSAPRSAERSFADTEGIGSGVGFRLVRVAGPGTDRELASRY